VKDTKTAGIVIEEACSIMANTKKEDIRKLRDLAARVGIDDAHTIHQADLCKELLTGWLTVFGQTVVYPTIRNGTFAVFSMMMLHHFARIQGIVVSIMGAVTGGVWASTFGLPVAMISQCATFIKSSGIWNTLTLNSKLRRLDFVWNTIARIPGLQWVTLVSVSNIIALPKTLGYRWVLPDIFRTNETLSRVFKNISKAMPFRKDSFKSDLEQIWRVDLPENYLPYGLSIAAVTMIAGCIAMFRHHNRDFFFKYDSRLKKLHVQKLTKLDTLKVVISIASSVYAAYKTKQYLFD
jgi:hypothetical protein